MTTVGIYSAGGSPGVSTLAAGLAYLWPRSSLLVETGWHLTALAGRFGGTMTTDSSLLNVINAARIAGDQTHDALWAQAVALPEDTPERRRVLLPGLNSAHTSASLTTVWPTLAGAFSRLGQAGIDTVIDGGRIGPSGTSRELVQRSVSLLVVEASLKQVAAARWAASELAESAPPGRAFLVLMPPPKHAGVTRFDAREITSVLAKLPVMETLPRDPETVAWLTYASHMPKAFPRSRWATAVKGLASRIEATATHSS